MSGYSAVGMRSSRARSTIDVIGSTLIEIEVELEPSTLIDDRLRYNALMFSTAISCQAGISHAGGHADEASAIIVNLLPTIHPMDANCFDNDQARVSYLYAHRNVVFHKCELVVLFPPIVSHINMYILFCQQLDSSRLVMELAV